MLQMGKLSSSSYSHKSLLIHIFLLTLLIVLQMNTVLLVGYPEVTGRFLSKKASLQKAKLMYSLSINCRDTAGCSVESLISPSTVTLDLRDQGEGSSV